jgi:hypothetical protein
MKARIAALEDALLERDCRILDLEAALTEACHLFEYDCAEFGGHSPEGMARIGELRALAIATNTGGKAR